MTDARDRDDEPDETLEPQPLDPDIGIDADPADVLEQSLPVGGAALIDVARGTDLPYDDPAVAARLREDALEAEPPV